MEMFAPFKKLLVATGMSASDKKNQRAVVCKFCFQQAVILIF